MKPSYKERQHALRSWNIQSLPETPFAFARFFVGHFRSWYLAILLLQVVAVICTVLVPWVLGQITRVVSTASADNLNWQTLSKPLLLFAGLLVLEVLCTRGATGAHIRVLPLQRRTVTHAVYAYLQRHSHRFVSSEFAGALAHKISEVSMGVGQALALLLFDLIPLLVTLTLAVAVLATASAGRWRSSPSAISWPNAVTRCPSNTRRRAAPATARWSMRCPT